MARRGMAGIRRTSSVGALGQTRRGFRDSLRGWPVRTNTLVVETTHVSASRSTTWDVLRAVVGAAASPSLTDRGGVETTSGVSATNTVTSGSFTPAAGARLAVVADGIFNLAGPVLSVTDTWGNTWARGVACDHNFGNGYERRLEIWTAPHGGSGSGTVTVTRTAGTVNQFLMARFVELAAALGTGATATNDTTNTTSVGTLSGAAASTSLALGGADFAAFATIIAPTGWTELGQVNNAGYFESFQSSYKIGSVATVLTWTESGGGSNPFGVAALEITAIPPSPATRATTWRALAPVVATRATTWRVIAPVAASRLTTWRVVAPVEASRATTWNVVTPVAASRSTTWDVLTPVAASRATTWDVVAITTTPVAATRSTTWNVLTPVTATRATTWRVIAPVAASSATTWNVAAPVTASRATTWRVVAPVEASRATTWDVLAAVAAARATTWNTVGPVEASRATTWRVTASVSASRDSTWNVVTPVTAARATTWRVLTAVAASQTTTWAIKETVGTARATTWNVLVAVGVTVDTTWQVLVAVEAERTTTWAVRGGSPGTLNAADRLYVGSALVDAVYVGSERVWP